MGYNLQKKGEKKGGFKMEYIRLPINVGGCKRWYDGAEGEEQEKGGWKGSVEGGKVEKVCGRGKGVGGDGVLERWMDR